MKKIEFQNTEFLRAVIDPSHYPILHRGRQKIPEVAIVGRSNVGKSSLINHLTQCKTLAKTSSVPGKTQTINFYLIDNRLCLVDLPGYGFSKVSHTVKKTWAESLETYLKCREELNLILVLIDLRRDISPEDKGFIEWAMTQNKPLFFIFTKADKLNADDAKDAEQSLISTLAEMYGSHPVEYITYSTKQIDCRLKLRDKLYELTN
ncbi:MAG: YihA family ribosome biogenesis GTP-binding protein [Chlamydiae bacterium]|nr:YihA family ribosome biogenesis GTP-binding protein [Chlamydiota bacterium]